MLGPALVVGGVELGLRLFGYGYGTDFFQPTRNGAGYTFNEQFRRQYYPRQGSVRGHPFRITTPKPPNTTRIFVLGESAALGTPNPSFGFARILAVLLRERYPGRKFEVVNAAMRGIDSYIIRDIAVDCTRHEPDLFVVYAGNNEVVGFGAPEAGSGLAAQNLTLIRSIQALKRTRVGQLLESALQKLRPQPAVQQDMEFFRRQRLALDDPRREAVYRNFRANLADLCATLATRGTPVLVATIPVNLCDFPPLASLHRPSLDATQQTNWDGLYQQACAAESALEWQPALDAFQRAAVLDDHYAELHFRMARCQLALGRQDEGRVQLVLARDWDALQFRADSRINTIIRETAARFRDHGVRLVEAEAALAASPLSNAGLPGDRLFQDHVHPRFDGDYLIACAFLDAIVTTLGPPAGEPAWPTGARPSRHDCAQALAFTGWDELEVDTTAANQLARAPFLDQAGHDEHLARLRRDLQARQAVFERRGLQPELDAYRRALQRVPDDWELHHNLGMLLLALGRADAAIPHLEVEAKRFPELAWCRIPLCEALAAAGRLREAEAQLEAALRLEPDLAPARDMLAAIRPRPAK